VHHLHTHTHTRLTALFPGLPGWASTRKLKPIWISLEQETVSGSGISWAICKSAPRCRQITTPVPHHSVHHLLQWFMIIIAKLSQCTFYCVLAICFQHTIQISLIRSVFLVVCSPDGIDLCIQICTVWWPTFKFAESGKWTCSYSTVCHKSHPVEICDIYDLITCLWTIWKQCHFSKRFDTVIHWWHVVLVWNSLLTMLPA